MVTQFAQPMTDDTECSHASHPSLNAPSAAILQPNNYMNCYSLLGAFTADTVVLSIFMFSFH